MVGWGVLPIMLGPLWGPMNAICCSVNVDGRWFYLEVVGTPQYDMV